MTLAELSGHAQRLFRRLIDEFVFSLQDETIRLTGQKAAAPVKLLRHRHPGCWRAVLKFSTKHGFQCLLLCGYLPLTCTLVNDDVQ